MDLERSLADLAADRRHGAGYLARRALGILAATPASDRAALAGRLAALRPSMPAIAAAVEAALESGDVAAVLRRADAERRRVAERAAARLRGRIVATISNSSLVTRALIKARPRRTEVAVEGERDEGHLLLSELRANGLPCVLASVVDLDAEIAAVGCDAVFPDGAFVNRRGTAALVARMAPRPVLVLTERWKRVEGPAPAEWPEPDLFEIVSPAANIELL